MPKFNFQIPQDQARHVAIDEVNGLLFDIVKLLTQYLVHGEHVYLILLEHQLKLLVATDLALVGWVLKVTLFDISPYLFDDLGSRKLGEMSAKSSSSNAHGST